MKEETSAKCTGCYFERNDYGFMQKRIYGEKLDIPVADSTRGLDMKQVLCPKNTRYGR